MSVCQNTPPLLGWTPLDQPGSHALVNTREVKQSVPRRLVTRPVAEEGCPCRCVPDGYGLQNSIHFLFQSACIFTPLTTPTASLTTLSASSPAPNLPRLLLLVPENPPLCSQYRNKIIRSDEP